MVAFVRDRSARSRLGRIQHRHRPASRRSHPVSRFNRRPRFFHPSGEL
ncbi:pollen-specific leucine-rich repeat extensin-like protein 3 [Iris pallida]|uniref:Pollen-specific leucine-rich repeat extensin-like protein 3 n=1 Tax=Iris pallida TaxID=29817 RepID=A0AAX6FZA6_IRIPA|nr:pollen-specific leucine-rich repeat extensin-like protein 3 [Iris pallida]